MKIGVKFILPFTLICTFLILITKHTDISSWFLTFDSCARQGGLRGSGGLPCRAALLVRLLQCF